MERLGFNKALEDGFLKFPVITAVEYGLYTLAREKGVDLPVYPIYMHYAIVTIGGGIASVIKYGIDLLKIKLIGES